MGWTVRRLVLFKAQTGYEQAKRSRIWEEVMCRRSPARLHVSNGQQWWQGLNIYQNKMNSSSHLIHMVKCWVLSLCDSKNFIVEANPRFVFMHHQIIQALTALWLRWWGHSCRCNRSADLGTAAAHCWPSLPVSAGRIEENPTLSLRVYNLTIHSTILCFYPIKYMFSWIFSWLSIA